MQTLFKTRGALLCLFQLAVDRVLTGQFVVGKPQLRRSRAGLRRTRLLTELLTIAAAILLPLATSQVGRPAHLILFKLFLPAGIITFVNVINKLTKNERIKTILCKLSSTVFFIYATHEIYLLGWTKGMFMRIFGNSLIGTWISYFGVPIIVLGLCLVLYFLLNK